MRPGFRMRALKQGILRAVAFHIVKQEKKRRLSYPDYISYGGASGQAHLAARNRRVVVIPEVIAYPLPSLRLVIEYLKQSRA